MAELILGHFYIRLDNVEYGKEKLRDMSKSH